MFEKEFAYFMAFLYFSPIFVAVLLAIFAILVLGAIFKVKVLYRLLALVIAICLIPTLYWQLKYKPELKKEFARRDAERSERQAKYDAAKAVFDEQCKTAGEKIYRTVDNVDGIMLLKVWGENNPKNVSVHAFLADPMWEYAAYTGDDGKPFIGGFLKKGDVYKDRKIFKDTNGYKYVDVPKNGQFIRYNGEYTGHSWDTNPNNEEVISKSSARYAVTFETDVNPDLRKHWVAGATFKIIDLETNELLAERTTFRFEQGLGSRALSRSPWLRAAGCGYEGKLIYKHKSFYDFVFFVLKPKTEL